MHIIIDTEGALIEKHQNMFRISQGGQVKTISPETIQSISILKPASITTPAILLAAENNVQLVFFDQYGKPMARMWSPYFGSIATIRRNQLRFCEAAEGIVWVMQLFQLKVEGQIENLRWLYDRNPSAKDKISAQIENMQTIFTQVSVSIQLNNAFEKKSLLGIEGSISRLYWESIAFTLQQEALFENRSRRPAKDPFNALLNYLYGMLYSEVEGIAIATGLDPQLGILHADDYNTPSFVFDAIEPFRPWVDRLVMESFQEKKVNADFFEQKDNGTWLSSPGKRYIIPAFHVMMNEKTDFNQKRIKREDQIRYLLNQLAQRLKKSELNG